MSASSDARNAAHVSNNTPRTSGNRDFGSAGYGWAPVKRRRRPVTEGGVVARFLGSLIDPAGDNGGPRFGQFFRRAIPLTTRGDGKARAARQSYAAAASMALISRAFVVP